MINTFETQLMVICLDRSCFQWFSPQIWEVCIVYSIPTISFLSFSLPLGGEAGGEDPFGDVGSDSECPLGCDCPPSLEFVFWSLFFKAFSLFISHPLQLEEPRILANWLEKERYRCDPWRSDCLLPGGNGFRWSRCDNNQKKGRRRGRGSNWIRFAVFSNLKFLRWFDWHEMGTIGSYTLHNFTLQSE